MVSGSNKLRKNRKADYEGQQVESILPDSPAGKPDVYSADYSIGIAQLLLAVVYHGDAAYIRTNNRGEVVLKIYSGERVFQETVSNVEEVHERLEQMIEVLYDQRAVADTRRVVREYGSPGSPVTPVGVPREVK